MRNLDPQHPERGEPAELIATAPGPTPTRAKGPTIREAMKIEATNERAYVLHLEALETLNQTRPHGHAVTLTPDEFARLVRIERRAHRDAEAWCNGDIDQGEFERREERHLAKVRALLGHPLPGLFVNGDPRGYALKIDPEGQPLPEGMQKDWGGYGILAPQF